MKLNKLVILSLSLVTLLFTYCTKSDDDAILETEAKFDFGKTVSRAFKGTVVDVNNNPLANVTVKLNGKTVTTNAEGVFTLSNVSVRERFAFITTEKVGYINGSRTLATHEGLNSLRIMMLPETVVATVASGTTSVVSITNNVKVTFDGSFTKTNGTAYSGNVKVIMNHLASNDPFVFDKMPGNLLAVDDQGQLKGLETYGMINVELKGANNEKLQLTAGHNAKVEMSIAPNQLDTAPAKIARWHFDEVQGLWIQEGFSTRVGSKYIAEVAHFSWWNNDDAYVVGTLNVTVTSGGSPVSGVRCTITRLDGSTGDVLMDLGITNANGLLSSPVPLNEPYIFRAYVDGVERYSEEVPSSNQLIRNILIDIGTDTRPGN